MRATLWRVLRALGTTVRNALWTWVFGSIVWPGRKVLVFTCTCGATCKHLKISEHQLQLIRGRVSVRGAECAREIGDSIWVHIELVRSAPLGAGQVTEREITHVHACDYGVTWVWGWTGERADAFRAQCLLVESVQ